MGTVIYSATAFEVYFWDLAGILLSFALASILLLLAIVLRRERIRWRILLAAGAAFMAVIGYEILTGSLAEMRAEPRTTTALVERLDTVDPDDYCTAYALEGTVRQEAVIFFVAERAFDQVSIGSCYTFTYHTLETIPYLEALGMLNWQYAGMRSACHVTRIVVADDSACR